MNINININIELNLIIKFSFFFFFVKYSYYKSLLVGFDRVKDTIFSYADCNAFLVFKIFFLRSSLLPSFFLISNNN